MRTEAKTWCVFIASVSLVAEARAFWAPLPTRGSGYGCGNIAKVEKGIAGRSGGARSISTSRVSTRELSSAFVLVGETFSLYINSEVAIVFVHEILGYNDTQLMSTSTTVQQVHYEYISHTTLQIQFSIFSVAELEHAWYRADPPRRRMGYVDLDLDLDLDLQ